MIPPQKLFQTMISVYFHELLCFSFKENFLACMLKKQYHWVFTCLPQSRLWEMRLLPNLAKKVF